ncbi:MAG: hypothetical protein ACN4E2_04125 [Nitrospinota bacterium]
MEKIDQIVSLVNEKLVENNATLEDVETLLQLLSRHFLDNLNDIADIDYFQDRLNNMIDQYVDTQFEDVYANGDE